MRCVLTLVAAAVIVGCSSGGRVAQTARPRLLAQTGLPVEATRAAIPADNPQSAGKIALGQKLFFDGRLSAAQLWGSRVSSGMDSSQRNPLGAYVM